ncbi:PDR/VanB family oxidoreductase [Acuticoccus mangrovi]|uniref:Oxidoreductase n=1 Tax=Acuticoccus mangrovi TaxID=2796142 RepID=A0A934IK31_9HYPH|nr:PDR/VanB family oxidoreductase [Acuticoccus mangrovi]MBJ3778129.1 oxidoreductase [Acuticoccus mangrovi]
MIEVIVSQVVDVASDIRALTLESADGTPLPAYEPGAHIDVHVPGTSSPTIRQYSLCRAPGAAPAYEIAVQRAPDSRGGSVALHDNVRAGDRIAIEAPRCMFPIAADARRHLLVGGGIGVTPLLSMAEALAARGAPFALHYCARNAAAAAFVDRLEEAPFEGHAQLHLDDRDGRPDIAALLGPFEAGTHVYVCGPDGFMRAVIDAAEAAGWPAEHVHREYFTVPTDTSAPEAADADGSFEVELSSSGKVYVIPPGASIAEVLEADGVMLPLSCEAGVCGSCMTKVLAGIPDHRDYVLTPAERDSGTVMCPCVSRALSKRLVLDV